MKHKETLKLTVAPEKSGIHAASKGVIFLGYRVSTYTSTGTGRKSNRSGPDGRTWRVVRRPTRGNVSLRVPRQKVTAFCRRHGYGDLHRQNGRRRRAFAHTSDRNIVLAYNSEFRGFAHYYALADDVKSALGLLELVVFRSLIKTLAMRHCTTTAKIQKRLSRFRHVISGSLTLASLDHTWQDLVPPFLQRSPPLLLTTAACSGLRPAPDCRPRGAHPHLS